MTERDRDRHERREDVVGRLKGAFADVPASRVLSEELIAERREEAAREEREFADLGPFDPKALRHRMAEFKRGSHGTQ